MAATSTSTTNTFSSIRLEGSWGQILRWLWIAFTVMSVLLLVISLPPHYQATITVCDETEEVTCAFLNRTSEEIARYESADISIEFVALNSTIAGAASAIIFTIIGSIIFILRRNELIALVTAFTFVAVGITGPIDFLQPDNILWEICIRIIQVVAVISITSFFFTFPNGRFVPAWTRWVFGVVTVLTIVAGIAVTLDYLEPVAVTNIAGFSFIIGLGSQIYRYFRISKPAERQQTKWVVASFFLVVIIFTFSDFSTLPGNSSIYLVIGNIVGFSILTLMPVSVLVSILRFGLWDIDFYINRGIVYLSLTVVLGIVFAGLFFLLQSIFTVVLGSSQSGLALILPTAVVVGLFNPARTRLRHFVDRRFYGIKMDYTNVIESRQQLLQQVSTETTIGQYRTTTLLGSGGMGEVYAGQDTNGERVAIKVLHTRYENDKEIERRFLREASATARLQHPHIVKIREVGEDDGRLFIAMEYVRGQDWSALLKSQGQLPLSEIMPRLEEIASALDYVHENNIVHRDIKPSNIMIEAETSRAILMDFGIAKITGAMTAITGTSQIVGSLDYISPEQIKEQENIDHRTDIYSFAVMTYQLLTGELPFHKANVGGLVMAHLLQPPPDASDINPNIADATADAIMRGMAKDPSERFASVSEFVSALQ